MRTFSLFVLCLLLVFSSCNNKQDTIQSTAISGNSNGTSQITTTPDQDGLAGKTTINPTNGESTSSSLENTHPVFDIKDFDKFRFDETSQIFNFDVQSAVSIIDGRNLISYLLVITPKINERIENIVVTASLDPKWSEILTDKNRNTLYFGTNKDQPFSMENGSSTEKGLISDIGKYLQDDIAPEKAKDFLKLPIKIVIKYNNKISSFTIKPSKILFLGADET
jgi:hypothetical protein